MNSNHTQGQKKALEINEIGLQKVSSKKYTSSGASKKKPYFFTISNLKSAIKLICIQ